MHTDKINLLQKIIDDDLPPSMEGDGLPTEDVKKLLKKSYDNKVSNYKKYKVDKKLSTDKAQVYFNPELNKAVVVHRGTADLKDWGTNVLMSMGIKDARYKHAKRIQNKAEKKYGKENIITMGHSQGARWAEKFGRDTDEVITLNKPTLPLDLITGDVVPENQTDVKTTRDPVSFLRPLQKGNEEVTIQSSFLSNPLSEHSIDVLDRLEEKNIGTDPLEEKNVDTEKVGTGTPYDITNYTKRQAKKLKVKVKPSKRKNKKIDVFDLNDKYIVSIGAAGYKDFPTYTKEKGKKFAEERRRLYRLRHKKGEEGSASYYAHNLLW
jgi:hypothetical protein